MKKYYIHINDRQEGPFSLEQLRSKHLTGDSPIWHDGLTEWAIVKNLPEVNELIPVAPPPFKNKTLSSVGRFLGFAGSVFLISMGIMAINSHVNTSDNSSAAIDPPKQSDNSTASINPPKQSNNSSASIDPSRKKVMTVEEMEKADPLRFISASAQYRKTIFGNKYVLNMKIENSATVTKYKGVVVKIDWVSETNSVVSSEERHFDEIFSPHSTKNYEFKINKPSESSKLKVSVIQARVN